jgi:hypothetical protein
MTFNQTNTPDGGIAFSLVFTPQELTPVAPNYITMLLAQAMMQTVASKKLQALAAFAEYLEGKP